MPPALYAVPVMAKFPACPLARVVGDEKNAPFNVMLRPLLEVNGPEEHDDRRKRGSTGGTFSSAIVDPVWSGSRPAAGRARAQSFPSKQLGERHASHRGGRRWRCGGIL
jgi:hypothetical protein